jgi:hypothetical protein
MLKSRRSQAARYVQDSEVDEEDVVNESPQPDADENGNAVSEVDETVPEESDDRALRRKPGRPRNAPPVVAVKKKMGGSRPGAGRKRKRYVMSPYELEMKHVLTNIQARCP